MYFKVKSQKNEGHHDKTIHSIVFVVKWYTNEQRVSETSWKETSLDGDRVHSPWMIHFSLEKHLPVRIWRLGSKKGPEGASEGSDGGTLAISLMQTLKQHNYSLLHM